jgi:hypothetical protein
VNGTTDTELHFTTRVSPARQAAHASSGHSPPINSRSMTATLLSALSRRPAATSTPGPIPHTATSKCSLTIFFLISDVYIRVCS